MGSHMFLGMRNQISKPGHTTPVASFTMSGTTLNPVNPAAGITFTYTGTAGADSYQWFGNSGGGDLEFATGSNPTVDYETAFTYLLANGTFSVTVAAKYGATIVTSAPQTLTLAAATLVSLTTPGTSSMVLASGTRYLWQLWSGGTQGTKAGLGNLAYGPGGGSYCGGYLIGTGAAVDYRVGAAGESSWVIADDNARAQPGDAGDLSGPGNGGQSFYGDMTGISRFNGGMGGDILAAPSAGGGGGVAGLDFAGTDAVNNEPGNSDPSSGVSTAGTKLTVNSADATSPGGSSGSTITGTPGVAGNGQIFVSS